MKYVLIALVLALVPLAANADFVAKQGDDRVRLSEQPCTHEAVLVHIDPKMRELYFNAWAHLSGHDYLACWTIGSGRALMVYEDGDAGIIPAEDLKRDEGV